MQIGPQWANEPSRPRVARVVQEGWQALLHDWIADNSIARHNAGSGSRNISKSALATVGGSVFKTFPPKVKLVTTYNVNSMCDMGCLCFAAILLLIAFRLTHFYK